MARYVGIDIGATQVKVAIVRGHARRYEVERLIAVDRVPDDAAVVRGATDASTATPLAVSTVEDLLREAASDAAQGGDPLSVGFDGARTYVRTLEVPPSVRKRISEVLPFELEAQLPFDIDDAVFDQRIRGGVPLDQPQPVLVAAARINEVRERIDLVKRALGREPDHVAPGAFPLADLAAVVSPLPALAGRGPRAILDLGYDESEIVVVDQLDRSGTEPVYARTLSRGVQGLPASAPLLAREIRQTFASYKAAGGTDPIGVWVTGGGALVADVGRWLVGELQMPVEPLPLVATRGGGIEGLEPEKYPEAHRFARAIGIALCAAPRRRGLDLRRGPLSFERGYGFLREKVPLLAGIGAATLVTFLFATWARARNVTADHKVLESALAQTTRDVFGEATTDVDRANELLAAKGPANDDDPLPRADAMDVLVQLSELIPTATMKHDIEKLDVARLPGGGFKVTINGIAPTGPDVTTIETNLKVYRCFQNPTVIKKTKAISDDRQKYTLETELRCPEEGGGAKKPTIGGGASSTTGGR